MPPIKTLSKPTREQIQTPIGPGHIVGRSDNGQDVLCLHYVSEVTWTPVENPGLPWFYKYWTPQMLVTDSNPSQTIVVSAQEAQP